MSNAEEVLQLRRDYEHQLRTDPTFAARARLAANVLEELEKMGRLEPRDDNGYAGFIVVAALEKVLPVDVKAEAWQRGATETLQAAITRTTATNPYTKETS